MLDSGRLTNVEKLSTSFRPTCPMAPGYWWNCCDWGPLGT